VLLPNKDHTVGELEHYSLHYNVALVSIKNYNVDCPKLECELMRYCGTVVAVGRCFESGILMATSGEFIHDCDEESIDSDCEYFSYTTCRTTKVAPFPFLFKLPTQPTPTCLGLKDFAYFYQNMMYLTLLLELIAIYCNHLVTCVIS
jgi:hypothetical protein